MQYEIRKVYEKDELYHHGILGQKWGIRRYQYKDGSLTEEGKKRYGEASDKIKSVKQRIRDEKDAYRIFTNLGLDTDGYEKSDYGGYVNYREALKTHNGRLQSLKEELKIAKSEKKKVHQEETKEKLETDKRKLIEFGSIDEIKKNLDTFSPSEMTEIRNRFATELQVREQINKLASMNEPVSSIVDKKKKTPMSSKITAGTKYLSDNITHLSKAATQANMFYNQVTKASNVLLGTTNPLIV
jgi:hypothetical protein